MAKFVFIGGLTGNYQYLSFFMTKIINLSFTIILKKDELEDKCSEKISSPIDKYNIQYSLK